MKTDTIKKLVLGILVLVVVYVWYGNLQLFTSSDTKLSTQHEDTSADNLASSRAIAPKIAFQTPKVNPFSKPTVEVVVKSGRPSQSRPKKSPQPTSPKPSAQFHLVGTLTQANIDFVALADIRGRQILVQRGDSLGGWVAKRIRQDQVIFAQDKFRDTIRLVTIDLQ